MRVPITKMHGGYNDFVILDRRTAPVRDLVSFARWACDRHAGIGADGLIAIESAAPGADARMRAVNADGSEAEMCGNGIRCAARWLDEAGEGDRLVFQTVAGKIRTEIVARGAEYRVRVTMPCPKIAELALAEIGDAFLVDLGNPHVVILRPGVDEFDLERAARRLQSDRAFPGGTNVHVVARRDARGLRVRHWERGVGLTMACGTGAVAAAAVAIEQKIVETPVEVVVPGATLTVEWNGRDAVQLIGPAVRVFDTEVGDGAASAQQ
ncbi:MAG: diaminopimelate epimerase [Candidatus Baltobacteraceae bacterium]